MVIKSHHNVGGLPDCVDFKEIVEPLRRLFKDEVRKLGIGAGSAGRAGVAAALPWSRVWPSALSARSPRKSWTILREADAIFREEMALAGLAPHQLQPVSSRCSPICGSVGVMGDEPHLRLHAGAAGGDRVTDFMTADLGPPALRCCWTRSPSRIVGEVEAHQPHRAMTSPASPRQRLSGNNFTLEKVQSYQGFFAISARCGNKMATLFELLR